MNRRTFVTTAGALSVGLAGCSGIDPVDLNNNADEDDEDDEPAGPDGDPADVVREFYRALDEGDRQTALSLMHPDAPDPREGGFDEDTIDQLAAADLVVEEVEVTERTDERAVVTTTVAVTIDGAERSLVADIELRPDDGEWLLYQNVDDDGEATPTPTPTANPTEDGGLVTGNGPKEVVRRFYELFGEGRVEEARALLHPDSPIREDLGTPDPSIDEVTVDDTELVEESATRAVVEATITIVISGEDRTSTADIEVRLVDGEWLVYGQPEQAVSAAVHGRPGGVPSA